MPTSEFFDRANTDADDLPTPNTRPAFLTDIMPLNRANLRAVPPLYRSLTREIDPQEIFAEYSGCVGSLVSTAGLLPEFLGTASVIRKNTIISSRHELNGYALNDIKFQTRNGFKYDLAMVEDGSAYNQDYVILKAIPKAYQPYLLSNIRMSHDFTAGKTALVIATLENNAQVYSTSRTLSTSTGSMIQIVSNIESVDGFSGAPYFVTGGGFNPVIHAVGIHARVNNHPLFNSRREAFLFRNAYRSSELFKLLHCPNYEPPISLDFNDENTFSWFSLSMQELQQLDEKNRRGVLMRNTPDLFSATGIEVLKRYEAKGKATYLGHMGSNNKYKKNDASKWNVTIPLTQGTALSKIGLLSKDSRGNRGIHMGHKLSCAEYWNDGSAKYLRERIDKIKNSKKAKYTTVANKQKKIAELKARYEKYRTPGIQLFASGLQKFQDKMFEFMHDSGNYRLEWWKVNLGNSSIEPTYAPPKGHQWEKVGKDYLLVKVEKGVKKLVLK